jgi:hypothetical protein
MANSNHIDRRVSLVDENENPINGGNPLPVTSSGGGGGGVSMKDLTVFTEGTSNFTPVGGEFNDSGTDPSTGQGAVARITSKRAIHVNLRDNTGVEIGTASAPVRIDPTGTTLQPVSDGGGSLTVDGTVSISSLSGTVTVDQIDTASLDYDTGAGTVNQTVIGIALPGTGGPVAGGTTTNPVRIDPTGSTAQPVTDNGGSLTVDAPTSTPVPIAITDTADTLVKPGDVSNNAIRVNIVAGGASGGTSAIDETAFSEGVSLFTPIGGVFDDAFASDPAAGEQAATRITAKRGLHVNLRSGSGTEIGTTAAPVRTDPTGTTAQPVTDGGGSITVDGAVTVSGTVTADAGTGTFIVDQVDTASLDYDTGVGTVNQTVMGIALPGSGGPVAGGTATNPVRTDPTGTTAQPVTDDGGSLTIDGIVAVSSVGGTVTVDQVDSASLDYDTGGGTVNQTVFGIALPASGGPVAGGTATNPIRTDPTGTTTQPVSDAGGSLTVDGTVTANQGGSWTVAVSSVAGTVAVDQINAAEADYDTGGGTVSQVMFGLALPASGGPVAGGTATAPVRTDPTGTTAQPVTDNGGSLTVDDGGGSLTVDAPAATPVPIAVTDTSDTIVKAGDSGNNAIRVNIVAGAGSGGTAQADKSTFTEGTTSFTPVGGVFNETISADPTEDQSAAARITAKRALHVNLRTSGGVEFPGDATNGLDVDVTRTPTSTTSTRTSVAAATSTTTVLAANANRLTALFYNNSSDNLFLALGSGATTTNFTVRISKDGFWELPLKYTGIITGVWSGTNGAVRVTELTP